jgi:hypothetical protein
VKRVCVLYGERREKREGRRKNKEEEEALGEFGNAAELALA